MVAAASRTPTMAIHNPMMARSAMKVATRSRTAALRAGSPSSWAASSGPIQVTTSTATPTMLSARPRRATTTRRRRPNATAPTAATTATAIAALSNQRTRSPTRHGSRRLSVGVTSTSTELTSRGSAWARPGLASSVELARMSTVSPSSSSASAA